MLRVPQKRPRLRPRLENQFQGLAEFLAGGCRIDAVSEVLGTAADDHARDQPAVAEHVEHGEFFGDAQRWIVKRQGVADDRDFAAARALRQRRGDEIGRGHQTVSVLVVFVDADAIETQFVGVGEGVDVFAVEIVALHRIVEGIGQPDPGGVVLLIEVGRQIGPGH